MTNILVFGTSTTYGLWDIEGGWVQRLRKFLDEKMINSDYKHDYLIYNLGIGGDKSADILKRFVPETEGRLDDESKNIMLFHLGINDCIYNNQLRKIEVSSAQFRQNYSKLIALAKKYSKKIVVIGSMPVDKRVDPMPWSQERAYKNEYVGEFNKIMRLVAQENKVYVIEIYEQFITKKDYSDLLADGVHMNSEGHKIFFEIVKDFLIANKII